MYPNLHFAFKEWFGVDWQWAKLFNTFGLMMAVSFIIAAVVLHRELKRRAKLGLLGYQEEKIVVGRPASVAELLVHFILGFLIGFKLLGGLIDGGLIDDARSYISSSKGNILVGLLLGGLLTFSKWREKDKVKLAKPEVRTIRVWPHDRVADITVIAAVAGLLGAKLFHNFENWREFMKDPAGQLFAVDGLTFYGGLILAAIAILWYARKKEIGWRHLCDSAAPALMIAYAIGRIGCQVSGDGDWGIYNSAYASTPDAKIILADSTNNLELKLKTDSVYFRSVKEEQGGIPRAYFKAPSFLPNWMAAMNYAHNVNESGIPIKGCDGKYCAMLPSPVFPTPFYETVVCTLLFFILWRLRKQVKVPGRIFAIYLMMNGVERFLVEKIRVNTHYNIFGFKPTQAEIIAALLVITGIIIYVYAGKKAAPGNTKPASTT
jgi:phosphatidylglycerol---prolipoprotein diacylglyceryl transferase